MPETTFFSQEIVINSIIDFYTLKGIFISDEIKSGCIKNIQQTISEALKNVDETIDNKIKSKTSEFKVDTLVFGDVHGELRLFIQNLYLAGVIDNKGNYNVDNKKTVIQLGDEIDREGKHPFESMIYIRMLQKQAKEVDKDVHILFGNHEKFNLTKEEWWNENYFIAPNVKKTSMRGTIRKILLDDIKMGIVKLSYANKDTKLMCFHGRMSKNTIKQAVYEMRKEEFYREKMDLYAETKTFFETLSNAIENNDFTIKFKSIDIYKNLQKCNISFKDISDWMNDYLVKSVEKPEELDNKFLFIDNQGVYCRSKKPNDSPFLPELDTQEGEKYNYKPVQIGGHTPTTNDDESRRAKGFGYGIIQDKGSIFADADLVNGFQSIVGINSNTGEVYALEIMDNKGLKRDSNKKHNPSEEFTYLSEKVEFISTRQLKGINVKKNNNRELF